MLFILILYGEKRQQQQQQRHHIEKHNTSLSMNHTQNRHTQFTFKISLPTPTPCQYIDIKASPNRHVYHIKIVINLNRSSVSNLILYSLIYLTEVSSWYSFPLSRSLNTTTKTYVYFVEQYLLSKII